MLALVAVLAVLTSTHAAAQSSTSPISGAEQRETRRRRVRAPSPPTSAATLPTFYVLAFAGTLVHGKCLDFGPPPQVAGSPVFIYGCNGTVAQQVRVEEINDRHEVILHAGPMVIGIRNPMIALGGAAPGGAAPTEFRLELQKRANPVRPDSANQIFALDGDSIILAHSRPCISTDASLCPPPPPQLVVQVKNARGANRSPLVVGPRNLADSEFWEFKAIVGSGRYPTSGFVTVATDFDLWNAVCAFPKVRPGSLNVPIVDHPGHPDDGTLILNGPDAGPCSQFNIGWGSVIVVTSPNDCNHVPGPAPGQFQDIGGCINLSNYPPIFLPAGVTVRGGRRGTNFGPQLYFSYQDGRVNGPSNCGPCMLEVRGDYVRVTGLRLRGESRSTDESSPLTKAIEVGYPGPATGPLFSITTLTQYIATIDHNDISDWGSAAVSLSTPYVVTDSDPDFDSDTQTCTVTGTDISYPCGCNVPDPSTGASVPIAQDAATLANVRVARNFLHHNERNSFGYGVDVGRAFIEGNTFLLNRHAITAGGEPHNEYRASYNLVLSSANRYNGFNVQDFDMHGTKDNHSWFGGRGGFYVDILGNTFLGTNRENYKLRGTPCFDTDFHSNVSLEGQDKALQFQDSLFHIFDSVDHINIASTPNQFELPDPTVRLGPASLGVGDFDGDGDDDLFLATGSAWYYSPRGTTEWRFLSAKKETIGNLLFGDFDGDGRTDVFTQIGDDWMVSWGGISPWEKINHSKWRMTDFVIGDFVGDRRADVFFARGDQWFVSDGGRGPFVPYATSSFKIPDLAFGHFDKDHKNDPKTDVVGVVDNQWMVVFAQGDHTWKRLRSKLTDTMAGLIVADFDGNGIDDIAKFADDQWQVSMDGIDDWTPLSYGGPRAAIGRFDDHDRPGADILFWDSRSLRIISSGLGSSVQHSRQDMR